MPKYERDYQRRRQRGIDAFNRLRDRTPAEQMALNAWRQLLVKGDPADEPEARRLASAGGMSAQEIDYDHAIHFKKAAAPALPAAQPAAANPPTTSAPAPASPASLHEKHLDNKNGCLGSFKGPCQEEMEGKGK